MLDTLRQNSKSAVIYVFFGIIIVVFVFSFGPGSGGCRSGALLGTGSHVAANVNGTSIPAANFLQSYTRTYRDYQNRSGGSFTEEMARAIGLREQVMNRLIDRELLAQAAEREGVAVSDRELAEAIHKIPAFQNEGRFDQAQYLLIVERQLGTTAQQFEEELRRDMASQKMLSAVLSSAKVSDDEVKAAFAREKEKMDLEYVRFAPRSFKAEAAKPGDSQVDEFLKDNGPKVEEFYKSNSFRYTKPKRVQARAILLKADEKAPAADLEAAKKKIAEIRAKAVAPGADFAALAKEFSQDTAHKDQGGDLGEVEAAAMEPELARATFALAAGEVSEPVKTHQGFEIVKVEKVLPEEKKDLKAVERDIAAELLVDEGAKKVAKEKAEKALADLKAGKKLEEIYPAAAKPDDAQQALRLEMAGSAPQTETTGPFSPSGDFVPRIGVDPNLTRGAMALTEQKPAPDQVFEVNGNFYVISLKSKEHADFKELEGKMDEYREKARVKRAGDLAEAYLKALREKAKIERNDALLAPNTRLAESAVDNG
jgi:peptidyl-prolyl cis-trans isomerase D